MTLQAIQILAARRPAILYSDGIGDTLMSLPTLRALSRLLSNEATLIGSRRSLEILEAERIASELIVRQDDACLTARALKECDLLISVDPGEQIRYVDDLLNVLKPRWSVGWSSNNANVLAANEKLHFGDEVFEAVKFFEPALSIESFAAAPALGTGEMAFAAALRKEFAAFRCLVVHCETGGPKMLAIPTFRLLLDQLLSKFEDVIALVVGVGSLGLDDIQCGNRVVPCEGLSLAKSLALVGLADVFLGVDSGMLHAADLFRVPAVGLFGPTDPERWGCRFTRHTHIRAPGRAMGAFVLDDAIVAVSCFLGEN
jgi:hypothetical protein